MLFLNLVFVMPGSRKREATEALHDENAQRFQFALDAMIVAFSSIFR